MGYGYAAIQLALSLARMGVEVVIPNSDNHQLETLPRELMLKIVDLKTIELNKTIALVFRTPSPAERETTSYPLLSWFTMWETTDIPREWASLFDHTVGVFVPSKRQIEILRGCGITSKLGIIPLGVNPVDYHWLPRTEKSIYRFGWYGTHLDHRKGVDLLYLAFEQEFPGKEYPNVELWYKGKLPFNWPCSHDEIRDSRIKLFTNLTSISGNKEFLSRIDCFVFPSRGEGFGLPPLEAMATGLPVIASNWNGPEDYLSPEYSYPLDYQLVNVNLQSRNPAYVYKGYWAEPNVAHLRDLMRHCYDYQEESRAKGELAMAYVQHNWSWDKSAQSLIDNFRAIGIS
jgi:glycosyltransferase involved in cell wall biosynthesis